MYNARCKAVREPVRFYIAIFLKLAKIGLLPLRTTAQLKIIMVYNCTDIGSSTQCISEASTSPMYINGFSYDGIITGFWLCLIFCVLFFSFIYNSFIGSKQKTKHYE